MTTHDRDCSEVKDYSDGIFDYCLCEARVMNAVCEASVEHKTNGNRPSKVITANVAGAA